ncbi:hypothetical protein NE237_025596 [Protea cynaroides]|uniref:Uncharacterized protein n=1 Tax=Protea cynaroides TaxID=273540 RepID=A0A9Q0H3C4_9MAGN|nr:hypothetical protein NE237_025596 [Protea cynaroides]
MVSLIIHRHQRQSCEQKCYSSRSTSEKPSLSARDFDPLLDDLIERKGNRASEEMLLLHSRLSSQEELFARETLTRQVVETRSRSMKEEIVRLQKSMEEKDGLRQESGTSASDRD